MTLATIESLLFCKTTVKGDQPQQLKKKQNESIFMQILYRMTHKRFSKFQHHFAKVTGIKIDSDFFASFKKVKAIYS